MVVTDLEAVCRGEAVRVLAYLRGNRRFGDLTRGWRELEDGSPIRQLSEWRCSEKPAAAALLEPLLRIVRSPEFAGPSTCIALEAAHAVVVALCEGLGPPEGTHLAETLAEVSRAVCECVFEETHAQMDEATTMQMIAVLSLCTTAQAGLDASAFPASTRMQAFSKILSLWSHYRHSPTLRACAQGGLQQMLDFACASLDGQVDFLTLVLDQILSEVGPELLAERALLYLRWLQRLMTHPAARRWSVAEGPRAHIFQDKVPVLLLSISEHFGTSISVLSLLLPVVNRTCWLCCDHWAAAGGAVGSTASSSTAARGEGSSQEQLEPSLGALQVEALLGSIYLRLLRRAAAPLHAAESASLSLTWQEGTELLVVLLEALCDLLQAETVQSLWLSFDADWRRSALLEQLIQCVVDLFRDAPNVERPVPAHLVHLSTTVLTRIISAFGATGACAGVGGGESQSGEGLAEIKEMARRRLAVEAFMAKLEESPKKARQALEKSGLLDFVPLPSQLGGAASSDSDPSQQNFQEWALKLAWVLRCLNHCIPYAAMGEFFGQPKEDSEHAFGAFVDTFDWGTADIDSALRGFLQAFLLPKEAQQIDRVLKIFAHTYYRKHLEHCRACGDQKESYFRHPDAAYTFAFSVIMLNTDQHNPKLKRRMNLKDFLSNNRGINEGENIPEDVQTRIFESIRLNEIKTPNTGSLSEGVSPSRFRDLAQLVRKGYRDNNLARLRGDLHTLGGGFLERMVEPTRSALESALAMDSGAHSDALQGLEHLLRLTMAHQLAGADNVAEGLFFFGMEVFHEAQPQAALGRAASCLRALFRTAMSRLTCMSTRQLHMIVYLTAQFALYGLVERALPPVDATLARLLRAPSLVVDPPTGVVYNFLRKISTAPFKMLSFAEEGGGVDGAATTPAKAAEVSTTAGSAPSPESNGVLAGEVSPSAASVVPVAIIPDIPHERPSLAEPLLIGDGPEGGEALPTSAEGEAHFDEGSLSNDPLRPQIERAFELCDFDALIRALVGLWRPGEQDSEAWEGPACGANRPAAAVAVGARAAPQQEAAGSVHMFLCYLSSLFLALRVAGGPKVSKDNDLPWCPEGQDEGTLQAPQALQLPKRALSLNVLDGYETLRFALRLLLATLGQGSREGMTPPLLDPADVLELSVSAHVGLFHTLRRSDLCERTLKIGIAGIFQVAVTLLTLESATGSMISIGWPVRLLELLVRRAEGEPQLLVPVGKLIVEAVRSFITEVCRCRRLDRLEVWRHMLLLLFKAAPTAARALWPGARDREVAELQGHLWRQGIVWVLGHPELLNCLAAEHGGPSEGSAFWGWAMSELTTLAHEMAGSSRPAAARLLLDAFGALLSAIGKQQDSEEYAQEELGIGEQAFPESPKASAIGNTPCAAATANVLSARDCMPVVAAEPGELQCLAARAAAWSRVAISLLSYIGPALGRASRDDEADLHVIAFLKHSMLSARVPLLLSGAKDGPYWARLVLEKLVSMLTGSVSSGAPLSVVRDAVSLVAKFFLQNLHTLQRHECFGQLWLMVLRLMLLFEKRGRDDRDAELEEIAAETLKNLLSVLLSTRILGFVTPKGSTPAPLEDAGAPVWWQMTWDCIEVFLPGFGEEFSRSMLPAEEVDGGVRREQQPAVLPAAALPERAPVVEEPVVALSAVEGREQGPPKGDAPPCERDERSVPSSPIASLTQV